MAMSHSTHLRWVQRMLASAEDPYVRLQRRLAFITPDHALSYQHWFVYFRALFTSGHEAGTFAPTNHLKLSLGSGFGEPDLAMQRTRCSAPKGRSFTNLNELGGRSRDVVAHGTGKSGKTEAL